MTVYIEYAIAENFIIDLSLLYVSVKAVRTKIRPAPLFLSAAVGTAAAIIFPIFSFHFAVKIILKLLVGALMCVIASPKKPFALCGAFFFISFALGGGITAIFSLPFVREENGEYYMASLPAPLVICAATAGCAAIAFFSDKFYARSRIIKNSVECSVKNGGVKITARALIDSGNNFFYDGNPVSMISSMAAAKLISDLSFKTPIYEVYIKTVTGTGKIKIIKTSSLTIYFKGGENIINGAYFGISAALDGGEYDVILNGDFIK